VGRSPRIYIDQSGADNFAIDGQNWTQANAPDMTAGYTTINYSITLGSGNSTETFSNLTIWQDGVISLGLPTVAQKAFMSQFEGSQSLNEFPGLYFSAGYTDESSLTRSDGGYDDGYGVEVASGVVDFNPVNGVYQPSDATPVLRITWGSFDNHEIDTSSTGAPIKQIDISPNFFIIGNTQFDDQGAGYGIGNVSVNGGTQVIPDQTNLVGDYFAAPSYDFGGVFRSDILWRDTSGDVELWAAAPTSLGFQGLPLPNIPASTHVVAVGDFDGDGRTDILLRDSGGTLSVWVSQAGQGVSFQTEPYVNVDPSWQVELAADFNGDGKADILWRNNNGDAFIWVSNPDAGITFTGQDLGVVSNTWHIAGAGDFTGDGNADLLWRNDSGGVALWASQPGQAVVFAGQNLGVVPTQWQIDGVGDFNGDGKADILWRNSSTGDVLLWSTVSGSPSVTFKSIDEGDVPSTWQIQGVADYNGDGLSDILWRNANGDVYIWLASASAPNSFVGHDMGVVTNNWAIQIDSHFT
jgi:hypothetical protein